MSRRFKTTETRQSLTLSFPRLLAFKRRHDSCFAQWARAVLGQSFLACVHKAAWKSQDVGSWISWTFVKVPSFVLLCTHLGRKTLAGCRYKISQSQVNQLSSDMQKITRDDNEFCFVLRFISQRANLLSSLSDT